MKPQSMRATVDLSRELSCHASCRPEVHGAAVEVLWAVSEALGSPLTSKSSVPSPTASSMRSPSRELKGPFALPSRATVSRSSRRVTEIASRDIPK
eukprot:scaffold2803_cov347-Prasinococcus_capsulatus_cf.AAC.9